MKKMVNLIRENNPKGAVESMEKNKQKKVYVVGHKNPDTDSICSAIAYANLKRITTGRPYSAKRAGQINEETQYVLNRFGVKAPRYLSTVRVEVKDLDIHEMAGVSNADSLKNAWDLMREQNSRTVPVLDEGRLEGVISITDIAESYMDVYDAHVLSNARTKYYSIVETLGGEIVCGNEHGYFTNGKVVIAASSPDAMEEFIDVDDLVILGNRYETQLCALEMGVSCLVLCQGAKPSRTIQKLADDKNCVIISTPYDTFTAARLINQSIPVKYYMTPVSELITFNMNDWVEDIQDVMTKNRYRNFPVIDKHGMYVGLISRRRLMNINRKQVILMDHNEKTQAVDGIEQAEVLEIIDHHRLGGFETIGPVYFRNQPVGCTATIVAQMYQEAGVEVDPVNAGLLCSAIVSDTLMFRSPTCTDVDRATCKKLAKIAHVDVEKLAKEMFKAGSSLAGKTPKEICFQDFKRFSINGIEFGVGQLNAMDAEELEGIKEKLVPYLDQFLSEQKLQMVFMMLTNIIDESTELLCAGDNARTLVKDAFDIAEDVDKIILKGIVSRKKQLLPIFVETLQQ